MIVFFSKCVRTLTASALVASSALAAAQAYPDKPIRLFVPQAPGSPADLVSRAFGDEMSQALGKPIVIENRVGAGGTISLAALARSRPDGYTIGYASQSQLVFNLSIYSKPGYDSQKDFVTLGYVGSVSSVMVVSPTSKWHSASEVAIAAKAAPKTLTYSSGGSGTSHHLAVVQFSQLTHTELLHIPYRGAPEGVMAIMSGDVNTGIYNVPSVLSQVRSGKLKALAVTGPTRSQYMPNVPTMEESGLKGYELVTWFGFIAPAGTSPEIVARLNAAIVKAASKASLRAQLSEQGVEFDQDMSARHMAKVMTADLAKWPTIIRESGAMVE